GQSGQQRKTMSYSNERDLVPLVIPSEISGLADLRAYLKSGNLVVRMSFDVVELPSKHPRFIPRPTRTRSAERPMTAATSSGEATLEQKRAPQELIRVREHELTRSGPSQDRFFR
ncbi:MAG: hypothetical protein ACRD41_14585, partial [Candidatus Acidiferrales bacterium]